MGQHDKTKSEYLKILDGMDGIEQIIREMRGSITSSTTSMIVSPPARSDENVSGVRRPDAALARFARKIYLACRDREKGIKAGLLHDPAWDILLDLYIAHAQGQHISVTGAGLAGQVPESTALRWVSVLEKAGMLKRQADRNDKRRHFVLLSDSGLSYMRGALTSIADRMAPPLFTN